MTMGCPLRDIPEKKPRVLYLRTICPHCGEPVEARAIIKDDEP